MANVSLFYHLSQYFFFFCIYICYIESCYFFILILCTDIGHVIAIDIKIVTVGLIMNFEVDWWPKTGIWENAKNVTPKWSVCQEIGVSCLHGLAACACLLPCCSKLIYSPLRLCDTFKSERLCTGPENYFNIFSFNNRIFFSKQITFARIV